MNVIVVMVDTLRYDCVGFHGAPTAGEYPRGRTPNFDRFCAGAWVFDRYFTASYPTIPHRTDVFTGEYGAPLHTWRPLSHGRVTLPRLLAAHGYLTQLIHDTPHLVNGGHAFDYPFHYWTQIRGAEVDRALPPAATPEGMFAEIPRLANWSHDPLFDEPMAAFGGRLPAQAYAYAGANAGRTRPEHWNCARLFDTAARFCRDNRHRDRFFLWIDCFDPHEPWDVPAELMREYDPRPGSDGSIDPRSLYVRKQPDLSDTARAVIAAQYAAKTAWVDRCFGTLLDTLDETGLAANTALLLLSDHGTNVCGPCVGGPKFGKGWPVRQGEGHCVCAVRVPGGGSGRSAALVQPQDLFATICAAAQVPARPDIDSQDIVAVARDGAAGARRLALAGAAAGGWPDHDGAAGLVTMFDHDWVLELALRPEQSRLVKLGTHEDVAAEHPRVVSELHRAALAELERRGAHPELMQWLRSGGRQPFPDSGPLFADWPLPAGYKPYFQRLYEEAGR